ncbi:hypothetical protein RclHR1_04730009 [Rhizophagus clarus]|uniref:Kinase-like domain-containing protein n=1 Tax=Rhizophagus clarus TaxID=94130 RepID=A0A2Z6RIJ2_9GLOM|nr:hypothetical protein RclHR1_04730009 [Rhizophagus clarus]GES92873.1 kinase-like domain-containing protein [Rhizophagus clarus]
MRSFIKRIIKKLIRSPHVTHVKHINEETSDICKECKRICNTKRFQKNFKNWTSGNNDIDNFIKNTQLSSHGKIQGVIEWIPYDRLYDIKHIKENKVYRAIWIDGRIDEWDKRTQNWERSVPYLVVALKSLNNSKNIILESLNEIKINHNIYGITQDPEKKNYMIVLNCKYGMCNI